MMSLLFTREGSKTERKNGYIRREVSKSQVTSFMDGPLSFNWRFLLFGCHRIVQLQLFTLDNIF